MPTQNPITPHPGYREQGVQRLTELKHLEGHRSAKFLALLAEHLVRKGLLHDPEVVYMLDQVVD